MRSEGGGVAWCSAANGRPGAPRDNIDVWIQDGLVRIAITIGMEMVGSVQGDRDTKG
jgi:hypothetical protein